MSRAIPRFGTGEVTIRKRHLVRPTAMAGVGSVVLLRRTADRAGCPNSGRDAGQDMTVHDGATPEPLISFGLPVYNGAPYLRRAFDSILAQTRADFELIVSDNASTDGTAQIIDDYARRDPRIRAFQEELHKLLEHERRVAKPQSWARDTGTRTMAGMRIVDILSNREGWETRQAAIRAALTEAAALEVQVVDDVAAAIDAIRASIPAAGEPVNSAFNLGPPRCRISKATCAAPTARATPSSPVAGTRASPMRWWPARARRSPTMASARTRST